MANFPVKTKRLFRCRESIGVYLPKAWCAALNLTAENEVKMYVVGGVLCIQPVQPDSFVPRLIPVAARAPGE